MNVNFFNLKYWIMLGALYFFSFNNLTAQCNTVGHVSDEATINSPTCNYQAVNDSEGIGSGSERTYLGFIENEEYLLYFDLNGTNISCVQAQWLDPNNNPIGGWFNLSTDPNSPDYILVPAGADRLRVTTEMGGAWVNNSALLNYTNIEECPFSCDIQATVCEEDELAGPFNFVPATPNVDFAQNCLNQEQGFNNYGFITLNITQAGPLEILINGNLNVGYIDVNVFLIPPGESPCDAAQNPNNSIACGFAQNDGGCIQFVDNSNFGCNSNFDAPMVNVGDQIFIVAQSWGTFNSTSPGSTTFSIDIASPPSAQTGPFDGTINPVGPFCLSDPTVNLTAVSNGGIYTGNGVTQSGIFSPSIAGVGVHTIEYEVGFAPCEGFGTIDIEVLPDSEEPLFDPVGPYCVGETAPPLPTTSTNGITGNWNGSVNTSAPGTFTFDFLPNSGQCAIGTSITVEVTEGGTTTFDPIPDICQGDTPPSLPNTSNEGASGTWSPAVIDASVIGETEYTFTPDPGACAAVTSITVNVVETSSSVTDLSICSDELPYEWNDLVFNTSGSQTATIESASGCDSLATLNLTVIEFNYSVSGNDLTECGAQDGAIVISGLNPNETYSIGYNGFTPTNFTTDANGTITISGLGEGSYTDFIIEQGGCSEENTSTVNLAGPGAPADDAGDNNEICEGQEVTLTATNPDGADISWSNNVQDGISFVPPVGTTTYTVTADLNGCIASDVVTVTVNPGPNVSAGNDITICAGETIILSGSGANSYTWSNGIQNGVPFTPPSGTTTYTVTGEVNGCISTDQVTVTVGSDLPINFTADETDGCSFTPITFENLTPGTSSQCIWDMGDGTVLNGCDEVTHTYSQTGCFSVTLTVISDEGCSSNLTQNDYVCIKSGPIADFIANPMVVTVTDPSVVFNNESLGAVSYEWDFGDDSQISFQENPTHTFPSDPDEFYEVVLYATNELGCTDSTVRIIEVQEDLIFWVPNAFTPDGDDFNEIFQPIFTSGFDPQNFNMLIFNRWGEVLFESNNAAVGWDGTYGGKVVQDGVYVWKIQFRDKYTDERQVHTGHVTLLR